jgi:hypothetical protein
MPGLTQSTSAAFQDVQHSRVKVKKPLYPEVLFKIVLTQLPGRCTAIALVNALVHADF